MAGVPATGRPPFPSPSPEAASHRRPAAGTKDPGKAKAAARGSSALGLAAPDGTASGGEAESPLSPQAAGHIGARLSCNARGVDVSRRVNGRPIEWWEPRKMMRSVGPNEVLPDSRMAVGAVPGQTLSRCEHTPTPAAPKAQSRARLPRAPPLPKGHPCRLSAPAQETRRAQKLPRAPALCLAPPPPRKSPSSHLPPRCPPRRAVPCPCSFSDGASSGWHEGTGVAPAWGWPCWRRWGWS